MAVTCDSEFIKAIDNGLAILGQTYDLNGENADLKVDIKAAFIAAFSAVKPKEVPTKGKSKGKLTSFNAYIKDQFEKTKGNTEGLTAAERMAKFAHSWKTLTDDDKKQYEDLAEQQNKANGYETVEKSKTPSRPMTGYNYFYKMNAQKLKELYPELNAKERLTKAGDHWKALSDAEKQEYKDGANKFYIDAHGSLPAPKESTSKSKKKSTVNIPNKPDAHLSLSSAVQVSQ
jgi:hypothetical protein